MFDALRQRLARWRNRLVSDPGFQARAARFPLTRPIARAQARGLFDLVAGFVYSQILAAIVALEVPDHLAAGPLQPAELAGRVDLVPEAAERLLKAGAALGLFERFADGRFGLAMRGAAMRANPGIAAMVRHHRALYRDLADPVALLRGAPESAALAALWPYAAGGSGDAGSVADYSALMAASQPMIAREVIDAFDFTRFGTILDAGGGEGAFLEAIAAAAPRARLMLFDLAPVAARAQARLDAAGLGARCDIRSGSFLDDALPAGADLITFVRVLHDHDDGPVAAILARARAALKPGGRVLIAEPMAGTPGGEPAGDAYFGFYLLAMGSGRPRTPGEYHRALIAAGFRNPRTLKTATPLLVRAVAAEV